MRILGIDPGTATTGFGVIDLDKGRMNFVDGGVIVTRSDMPMPDRLSTIYRELAGIIAQHQPAMMAVELLYFATNVTTAMTVGQARGVILLAAAEANLPVSEYTPLQVKQAVAGYGKAAKPQIQEMVKLLLKLPALPKPDDAADALAIAITHAQQRLVLVSSALKKLPTTQ
jgi:crossover junction endodeoxyribonuclease RuvC